MASTGSSSWYIYTRANGRKGPISLEAVQALLEKGSLGATDLAWCPGMAEWKKLGEVSSFSGHFQEPDVSISFETTFEAPSPAAQVEEPTQQFSPTLNQLTAESIDSLELETQTFIKNEPATPAPIAEPKNKGSKHHIQIRVSKSAIRSLCAATVLGGLTYLAFPFLSDLFAPFPKIPELSEERYALLLDAAKADLKRVGPKVELVPFVRNDGGATVYIATNLPDQTVFELNIQPISDTLVGEPRAILPLRLSSKSHLAQAGVESVPPGYYWAYVSVTAQPNATIQRKVFLGGVPDLTYQTHLKDYAAVRRGIAKAELERIREALKKAESLMTTDNQAAESLSTLSINRAKAQAWEFFQPTWTRNFDEIQGLLTRPTRFSGKILRDAQSIQEPLKSLHEKHHALVPAVVTPASAPLSPGSVTTARVLADAQAISNEISAKIKALGQQLDEREKLFDNPLAPLTEEP